MCDQCKQSRKLHIYTTYRSCTTTSCINQSQFTWPIFLTFMAGSFSWAHCTLQSTWLRCLPANNHVNEEMRNTACERMIFLSPAWLLRLCFSFHSDFSFFFPLCLTNHHTPKFLSIQNIKRYSITPFLLLFSFLPSFFTSYGKATASTKELTCRHELFSWHPSTLWCISIMPSIVINW